MITVECEETFECELCADIIPVDAKWIIYTINGEPNFIVCHDCYLWDIEMDTTR